jgi:small subunit ribosomal protein S24e
MEIEITKEADNRLLMRKEVFFRLKHDGASPGRGEVRNALIKELRCTQNLLVIDRLKTEFGKKETVGYAKAYESEDRLRAVEREHILKRNFSGLGEGKVETADAKVAETEDAKVTEKEDAKVTETEVAKEGE